MKPGDRDHVGHPSARSLPDPIACQFGDSSHPASLRFGHGLFALSHCAAGAVFFALRPRGQAWVWTRVVLGLLRGRLNAHGPRPPRSKPTPAGPAREVAHKLRPWAERIGSFFALARVVVLFWLCGRPARSLTAVGLDARCAAKGPAARQPKNLWKRDWDES